MRLIQTKDYLLLIDEEEEINFDTDYIHAPDTSLFTGLEIGKIKKADAELATKRVGMCFIKVIAYYPLTKEAEELDLLLLPNPFKKEIDETILFKNLGDECFIKMKELNPSGGIKEFIRIAVEFGYKSAQSDKQFSLEDVRKAIDMAREMDCTNYDYYGYCDKTYTEEEIIQSLSNKQLPKFFIPEENYGDGALTKYKTIINSEGREELVGTYKY